VAVLIEPMAPVAGRTFLEILLGRFAAKGVHRAVLSPGRLAEAAISHFTNAWGGLSIANAIESAPLGTGGATIDRLTAWMRAGFEREGAQLAAVCHCPLHPEHGIGRDRANSFDRKPNPGMLLRARDALGVAPGRSVMIGDTASDMLAAPRGGVPLRCLYRVADATPLPDGDHTHVVVELRDARALLPPLDR
jgi:hypothetical protein